MKKDIKKKAKGEERVEVCGGREALMRMLTVVVEVKERGGDSRDAPRRARVRACIALAAKSPIGLGLGFGAIVAGRTMVDEHRKRVVKSPIKSQKVPCTHSLKISEAIVSITRAYTSPRPSLPHSAP